MSFIQRLKTLAGISKPESEIEVADTVVAMHEEARRARFGAAMPVYTLQQWWVRPDEASLAGICPEHSLWKRAGAEERGKTEEIITTPVIRFDESTMTCWTVNSVYRLGASAKPEVCLPALRRLADRLEVIERKIAAKKGVESER